MMEFAGTDETEKYRRYIQKRRVSPACREEGDEKPKPDVESEPAHPEAESVENHPYNLRNGCESDSARYGDAGSRTADYFGSGYIPKSYDSQNISLPAPRRTDTGLYRKLHGRSGRKSSAYPSVYGGYSAARAEVEDNRVTLFAVKLIKQALACFAILGIIIFMQSRPDMKDALSVVKKQVVETNIEPKSIYEGIRGIINQFTQALGGSP